MDREYIICIQYALLLMVHGQYWNCYSHIYLLIQYSFRQQFHEGHSLNDNQWHRVMVKRRNRDIQIFIDDEQPRNGKISPLPPVIVGAAQYGATVDWVTRVLWQRESRCRTGIFAASRFLYKAAVCWLICMKWPHGWVTEKVAFEARWESFSDRLRPAWHNIATR